MNNKLSLFLVMAIMIVPVLLYSLFKAPNDTSGISMAATGKPKVLKFSSPLCMECKELDKVLKVVQPKYEDKIIFIKLNTSSSDEEIQKMIGKYNVKVVPTTVFISKKGKVVKKVEGSMPEKELEKILDELVNG